ncbi:hypothetical protein BV898_09803 [Hypsibius exemplaris]|uniref:PH domain-containing protein n=1 Tax=Hypsibius exemplaris TaxID=2072580 RepID=A0A1W0WLN6_HYPEX|nr:hypothetical protein BV898_09803 [Hypsibius exemplaris]
MADITIKQSDVEIRPDSRPPIDPLMFRQRGEPVTLLEQERDLADGLQFTLTNLSFVQPKPIFHQPSQIISTTSTWKDNDAHPVSQLECLMVGMVMEWEKKKNSPSATIWNKTEYALARNGFLYRKRVGSGKELNAFDLRHIDVDLMPRASETNSFESGERPLVSLRFVKYALSGQELVWYAKHDSPDTITKWYTEIQTWKKTWYAEDWRKNLLVQTPRVVVEQGSAWDLGHIVAQEMAGESMSGQHSVIFDRDFESDSDQ